MNTTVLKKLQVENPTPDWIEIVRTLGGSFAKRAAGYDQNSEFVAANYQDLREHGLFSAGIPTELGGGGATHEDLSGIIRARK